jgi:hypothetical protein
MSQMTPLRRKKKLRLKLKITNQKNYGRHLTCFQRRRARPNVAPSRRRMRSKPASTNRSKTMSEIIVGMKASKLGSATVSQVRFAGSQIERIYGWDKHKGTRITKELTIHPYDICTQPMFV